MSEFGLNIPLRFMGKKNCGGWKNQYLLNSPYNTADNKHIFCYFTRPQGKNLLVLALSRADGWKADYLYYKLTGDEEHLLKASNGFMSNFSKIDKKGRSYTCYQPDYITGGGFTASGKDVDFRIVNGFPKQTDSGLSRYVWSRAMCGILKEKGVF